MNYVTPIGFRDVISDEALVREDLTYRVQQCFARHGYSPIETPTLEVLDVMEAGGHVPASPFKLSSSLFQKVKSCRGVLKQPQPPPYPPALSP